MPLDAIINLSIAAPLRRSRPEDSASLLRVLMLQFLQIQHPCQSITGLASKQPQDAPLLFRGIGVGGI